jgi:hypothetical protein
MKSVSRSMLDKKLNEERNQRTTKTNRFVVKDVLCSFVEGQNSPKKIVRRNQTIKPLLPLLLGKDIYSSKATIFHIKKRTALYNTQAKGPDLRPTYGGRSGGWPA